MKRPANILMGAAILGAALLFSPDSRAGEIGSLRVRLVAGDVQVRIAETGEWAPASVNMPLVEGDELWIPEDSRAAIQTNNGATVRLDEGTALQVLRTDRDSFQFNLSQGRAYVLSTTRRRSVLQIDTPDATIRAFGISTFRIDISGEETDLSVFKGSVLAENDAGTTTVEGGDMLALWGRNADLSPLPPPAEWETWNRKQDRAVLARGRSYGYLPAELRTYSSDFDENGRWVNVREYGYVWTPTVVVSVDWAPYRNGRWAWRGGDYVWIGYEPWGWTPYHYGRWAYSPGIGWFWVPPERGEVFWGPGYVGWVRTEEHVAWVPLAPRETYYGRGDYGRNSVNVTNVNINQVRVTNVYQNVNVINSVTVVNQSTFVSGRPSAVDRRAVADVREDFARRRNLVIGRPPVEPQKTSYTPVVRAIPEAKLPPPAVRKVDVKELKRSRFLVREPDRSAVQPETKPRALEVRKVEKPRFIFDRSRERVPAAPAETGKPPAAPAETGRTKTSPQERWRVREAPAEKEKPQAAPPERGRSREVPVEKEKPQAAPLERGRSREVPAEKEKSQVAPPERGRSREVPVEKNRPQAAPPEKGRYRVAPVEKEKPHEVPVDNVRRETPRRFEEQGDEKGRR